MPRSPLPIGTWGSISTRVERTDDKGKPLAYRSKANPILRLPVLVKSLDDSFRQCGVRPRQSAIDQVVGEDPQGVLREPGKDPQPVGRGHQRSGKNSFGAAFRLPMRDGFCV
jgi:hypothetical protein